MSDPFRENVGASIRTTARRPGPRPSHRTWRLPPSGAASRLGREGLWDSATRHPAPRDPIVLEEFPVLVDLRGSASRTAPHEACLTFDSYGPQGCSPSPARVCQEAPPPPCGCEASPQLHGAGSCHVGTFTHWVVPTSLVTPDPDVRVLPHPAPRQMASLRAVAYPLVQEARRWPPPSPRLVWPVRLSVVVTWRRDPTSVCWPSFPPPVPPAGAPFPPRGFVGAIPPLRRYYETLRLLAVHPPALRCLRPAVPSEHLRLRSVGRQVLRPRPRAW